MRTFCRFAPLFLLLGIAVTGCAHHPPEGLQVGQRAPEIEGEDVDGKRFKLSDFKGKVVVLDFWGFW
jgi:cytochrome oxidase Cu insertion factor (SCO1/SenC/PrrC family)